MSIICTMDIQNAYDEWSGTYDTDENLTRDLDQKVTRKMLGSLHFDSVLEIGCGTGKNTSFLAHIGTQVQAVDFSQGMIEKAREKVRATNVEFSMMDISQAWKFENGSFDLILCNLVLEHIENLPFVFSEASRTLIPGGKFFLNELHPFRQYGGKKARFSREDRIVEVQAYVHHISDFTNAATMNGLAIARFNEHWHETDLENLPRIASFMFEKI